MVEVSRSADALLAAIISRRGQSVNLDPTPLLQEPERERRLRRLQQNTVAYSRDTGIQALFLGFPFVVLRDARTSDESKFPKSPALGVIEGTGGPMISMPDSTSLERG
jgi:primosomal replication protein N''